MNSYFWKTTKLAFCIYISEHVVLVSLIKPVTPCRSYQSHATGGKCTYKYYTVYSSIVLKLELILIVTSTWFSGTIVTSIFKLFNYFNKSVIIILNVLNYINPFIILTNCEFLTLKTDQPTRHNTWLLNN